MKTVEEVLQKYTLGEAGKDETNDVHSFPTRRSSDRKSVV